MSKGEATRQRIVAKAALVFNRRGFGAAALSDVMRATRLQKGGIYRHFESKEDLALQAFDYARTLVVDPLPDNLEAVPNTVDRLKQAIAEFACTRTVPGGCPIFNAAIDADDGNPRLRARVKQTVSNWVDRWASLVREGQRRGEIRRAVDPREVATLVIAALEGALVMTRLSRSEQPLRGVKRQLNEFLEQEVRDVPRRPTIAKRGRQR